VAGEGKGEGRAETGECWLGMEGGGKNRFEPYALAARCLYRCDRVAGMGCEDLRQHCGVVV